MVAGVVRGAVQPVILILESAIGKLGNSLPVHFTLLDLAVLLAEVKIAVNSLASFKSGATSSSFRHCEILSTLGQFQNFPIVLFPIYSVFFGLICFSYHIDHR